MQSTYPKSSDELQGNFVYRYHYEKVLPKGFQGQVYLSDKWARLQLITKTCKDALKVLHCMALSPHWVRENPSPFNQTLNQATTYLLNSNKEKDQKNALRVCSLLYQHKLTSGIVKLTLNISNKTLQLPTHLFFILPHTNFCRPRFLGGFDKSNPCLIFSECSNEALGCLQLFCNEGQMPDQLSNAVIPEIAGLAKCYFISDLAYALKESLAKWEMNRIVSLLETYQGPHSLELSKVCWGAIEWLSKYTITANPEKKGLRIGSSVLSRTPTPFDYPRLIRRFSSLRLCPTVLNSLKDKAPKGGWQHVTTFTLLKESVQTPTINPLSLFPNLKYITIHSPSWKMLQEVTSDSSDVPIIITQPSGHGTALEDLKNASLSTTKFFYFPRAYKGNQVFKDGHAVIHKGRNIFDFYPHSSTLDLSNTDYPAVLYKKLMTHPQCKKVSLANTRADDRVISKLAKCEELTLLNVIGCNRITQAAINRLKKRHPKCIILTRRKSPTPRSNAQKATRRLSL